MRPELHQRMKWLTEFEAADYISTYVNHAQLFSIALKTIGEDSRSAVNDVLDIETALLVIAFGIELILCHDNLN